MFDSGIKATDLIAQIKGEADIAVPISDDSYIQWLNALEQLLYSEVIREQKKYVFGITSPLIKTKINLWPIFDSQTAGDMALTVKENGAYVLNTVNGDDHAVTGAVFEKTITLPAGEYTLSDNGYAYYSGPTATTYRTYVKDANTGTIYAGIDILEGNAGHSFVLSADTEVALCISVFPGAPYINGYTFRPQIVVGLGNTESVVKAEKTPAIVCDLPASNGEARVRFEDLHAVFVGNTQLMKTTLTSGMVFPNTYYKQDNQLGIHLGEKFDTITVTYMVRPVPKTTKTAHDLSVMVPAEFIDLVKAKLRGEAYKLANEDELAAVWLNDYNVLLETFKAWVSEKQSEFGM